MTRLLLYTAFHLNLAYSSIEEEQRLDVIRRCYWPLLHTAEELAVPIGIEASGYTLQTVWELEPSWVIELRRLCAEGLCEFIGSGYAQLIGPLVPARVNQMNQTLGLETYEKLLGFRPRVALATEQSYSSGLVRHFLDAGYEAFIMDWDNPASQHPGWHREWRYLPQRATDQGGREIPVVWNHSIPFQKFQRYVHAEMSLGEHLDFLSSHRGVGPRALCLYGNDAEVFDFRPGRFATEAPLAAESEWVRIRALFTSLQASEEFRLATPSGVLGLLDCGDAGNVLNLETADQPIPTKKQRKYNVTRWAVTGRADLEVNTACWKAYGELLDRENESPEDWRELCYLWSSDFRTHVTDNRWAAFRRKLAQRDGMAVGAQGSTVPVESAAGPSSAPRVTPFESVDNSRLLSLETESVGVRFDQQKGLAMDALWFPGLSPDPLCGTIPHGYFDDIGWGADFFSGHLVMEIPGRPKVTDLQRAQAVVEDSDDAPWVQVSANLSTPLGPIRKCYRIHRREPRVELFYELDWEEVPIGSLRLGYVTLQPTAFRADSLYYRTHNGGFEPETFSLGGTTVDHGGAVSFLVSARQALGVTEGVVEIGDARRGLRVEVDKSLAALVAMVTYRELGDTYFCRLAFSAGEMDDTSRAGSAGGPAGCRRFRFAISAL